MRLVYRFKLKCAERKITGFFCNLKPRLRNGKKTVFCIKKNVWNTMWPFFKSRETVCCQYFDRMSCPKWNCSQKMAHDEYMKIKNLVQGLSQQKEK